MNKNIKMVVLDMAGTTVNEDNLVYKTLHKTLLNEGIQCTLEDVLTYGAGKEKRKAVVDIIAFLNFPATIQEIDKIFNLFMNNLSEVYNDAPIFPQKNAEELFNLLHQKGMIVVLNTGYDSKTANLLLDKLKWKVGETIDQLVTASDVINGRPNPGMIDFAMKYFNITDPAMVAKIGDSIIDIEEGKNANCGLILGITTGAHTADQLSSAYPDAVIDNLLELGNFI